MDTADKYYKAKQRKWDRYFHGICDAVAVQSPCLSRNIGAILVRDKSIIATGYNGPPRGFTHCIEKGNSCPRMSLEGYESGKFLDICPAAHAEANCLVNAARNGVIVINSTLYMNCVVPCKDCMILLANAGITGVVVDSLDPYSSVNQMSKEIADFSGIEVRRFNL